jgi:hypothetical protein
VSATVAVLDEAMRLCLHEEVLSADVLKCDPCGASADVGHLTPGRRARRTLAFTSKHVKRCGVSRAAVEE